MKEQGAHQCAAGLDVLEGQAVVEKHSGPLLGSNTEPEGQDRRVRCCTCRIHGVFSAL